MLLEALGVIALLFGLFFCGVGVLGVIRMPDALSRLHASGKVATLGLFGLLVGSALLMPSASLRIIALGLFVLLTNPVATHAIAASVHRRQEILEELFEMRDEQVDVTAVDVEVSAILSRSLIQDIIEAQQRAQQAQPNEPKSNRN